MDGSIGIFDSGVGGFTTLVALRTALPQYSYHYLGDTARAPYGARDQETLFLYTKNAVDYLRANGCSLIIIACNTASTSALARIQTELAGERDSVRVLGILIPVAEHALALSKNKRIGVLATYATVASGKYPLEFSKLDPSVQVIQHAAPTLATRIESGDSEDSLRHALMEYLKPLLAADIDTLVLGCTHYSHIEHLIRECLPPSIALVHEGMCIGKKLSDYVARHADFAQSLSRTNGCKIETTKLTPTFATFARNAQPHALVTVAELEN